MKTARGGYFQHPDKQGWRAARSPPTIAADVLLLVNASRAAEKENRLRQWPYATISRRNQFQ